nr:dolichyl-diphosphooligosaccharide--protein glycosyltransferase 48 kDa subunit-like [Ipomoea batatas]
MESAKALKVCGHWMDFALAWPNRLHQKTYDQALTIVFTNQWWPCSILASTPTMAAIGSSLMIPPTISVQRYGHYLYDVLILFSPSAEKWTAYLCFEEPETALVSCKLSKECWSRMNTVLNPEGYSSFAEWIRDNLNALNIDDIVGV